MTAQLERDEDFFGKPAGRRAPGASMADLQSVYKKYGRRVALDGVTLPIKAREVTGVDRAGGGGQVDPAAVHRPPGTHRRRPDLRRR